MNIVWRFKVYCQRVHVWHYTAIDLLIALFYCCSECIFVMWCYSFLFNQYFTVGGRAPWQKLVVSEF